MDAANNGDCVVGDNQLKCLWKPDETKQTKMNQFREKINREYKLTLCDYTELYMWSIENYSEFWKACWEFFEIIHSKSYDQIIDTSKNISQIPEWFHGARLNYTENLLRYADDNRVAVISIAEGDSKVRQKTFRQLRDGVAVYASAMRRLGVQPGDRVAGYVPNCEEALQAMLATAAVGAVWTSAAPDFGAKGVLDRFQQIQPKILFSVNGVHYNNKYHNHMDKLRSVAEGLPDICQIILIPFSDHDGEIDISHIPKCVFLKEYLDTGMEGGLIPELKYEQLPFNHPLVILYSSGTTGPPKCIVHSAGGTLIQHMKEHVLHTDMGESDIHFYYTSTGWMMYNFLVSSLSSGSTIVMYHGAPALPTRLDLLWDIIDQQGVTVFGTAAKWIAMQEDRGVKPLKSHSLKTLRCILSTGSPLKTDNFEYVYRDVKQDVLLGSITGGTDIISCFAGSNPTVPVYSGEIQTPNLGMAIQCWDEHGKPVYGERGELVCVKPFPSMPIYFWNDDDDIRYKKAYFSAYPDIWHHGDYCIFNAETLGIVMLGRSDGTLNPNGVRFGSAELYTIVEVLDYVDDSLAVSQYNKHLDERVVLFLKMRHSFQFNEQVVNNVRSIIRTKLSPKHVPGIVLETTDIPYTVNGKKVEIAVKKIINGAHVKDRGSLANPNSLDLYYNIPQLQDYIE